MESVTQFDELTLAYVRKYFEHYDVDKIGRVETQYVPTLVRACGAVPLEADIEMINSVADPESRGSCNFDNFCKALKLAFDNSLTNVDVREAFQGLDFGKKGFISQHELRYYLCSRGNALSSEEINEFFEHMNAELDMEGNLLYVDAAYEMLPEWQR